MTCENVHVFTIMGMPYARVETTIENAYLGYRVTSVVDCLHADKHVTRFFWRMLNALAFAEAVDTDHVEEVYAIMQERFSPTWSLES